jgi:ComF family protein
MCRRRLYDFEFARSFAAYTSATVGAVVLLKYNEVTPLGSWFADRLFELAARYPEVAAVDAVVPVPQHHTRLRERGYNQAELIARPLARRLGLPYQAFLLVRTKPRPEKLRLTVRERWRTVRGAYDIREGARVDNLRVLLVDDVLTTGATLDACSRALRHAGAAKVTALTVARAVLRADIAGGQALSKEPHE